MKRILSTPPKFIQKLFNSFFWGTTNNQILLTFDDGPTPEATTKILGKLKEYNIKAIFFCVGENVKLYPELTSLIISDGHTIANHTMQHKNITGNFLHAKKSIVEFNNLMKLQYNYEMKFFRPPHGRFNFRTKKMVSSLQLKNVMWNLLTLDYKNDLNIVKFTIDNYLKKNSIIVLHDSVKSEQIICDSIEYMVNAAKENNFVIGVPSECLK